MRSLYTPDQKAPVKATIAQTELLFPGEIVLIITPILEASSMFMYREGEIARKIRARPTHAPPALAATHKRMHKYKSVEHFDFHIEDHELTRRALKHGNAAPEAHVLASIQEGDSPSVSHIDEGLSMSQALLWEIYCSSMKHGQLVKKRYSVGTKVEEEVWFAMLDVRRLWFFPLKSLATHHSDLAHLSYIDLPSDAL